MTPVCPSCGASRDVTTRDLWSGLVVHTCRYCRHQWQTFSPAAPAKPVEALPDLFLDTHRLTDKESA